MNKIRPPIIPPGPVCDHGYESNCPKCDGGDKSANRLLLGFILLMCGLFAVAMAAAVCQ